MFIDMSESKVDTNQICYFPSVMANRWLAVRLEAIGNVITFFAAIFTMLEPEAIGASEVGLVISYALNVTQTLTWLVSLSLNVLSPIKIWPS